MAAQDPGLVRAPGMGLYHGLAAKGEAARAGFQPRYPLVVVLVTVIADEES